MAKTKKKQAEKVLNKKTKSSAKKSVNPFEVHINKQKYEILGQKLKHDRGLPGVSRAKALQKRKHTLLPEFQVKNKSNKFMDRRIGEKNHSMTEEDRQMARFTAERVRHHNKTSIFNLADDEILTHRGQTLSEIEKFDDPRSDDEDDEMNGRKNTGKLADKFVRDAHFGGGILTKTGVEGAKSHKDLIDQLIAESKKRKAEKQQIREQTVELTEKLDSEWKDLLPIVKTSNKVEPPEVRQKPDDYDKYMRELRFEARGNPSDRLKAEDEIAKEEKEKLEKLEKDRLDRMRGFIEDKSSKKSHRSADDLDDNFAYDSDEPEEALAYDDGKLKKGNVDTDIIIPDEIDQSKSEDNPEEESGEDESSEAETDDDLSDLKQSDSESDSEESKDPIKNKKPDKKNTVAMEVIQYKEEPIKEKEIENITGKKVPKKEKKLENVTEKKVLKKEKKIENITEQKVPNKVKKGKKSSEESSRNDESDSKQFGDLEESEHEISSTKTSIEDNVGYLENEDDDSDTKESDLEDSEEPIKENKSKNTSKQVHVNEFQEFSKPSSDVDSTELNSDKLQPILITSPQSKKRKLDEVESDECKTQTIAPEILEIMEKAKKELPFTYSLPDSYESLQSTLNQQPPEYQDVIIERMIKCNHPSLGAENKENLAKLFIYLLQHLNDMVPDENPSENEMKHCFAVLNSVTPHLYSLTQLNPQNAKDSLMEVINEKQNEYKINRKKFPGVDVLVFLKLISCLFSTSDFRHQVVTPSLVFIGQMLTNCKIKNRYDITYGLFLVTLYLEYTTLSKRYMPSVLIYISGILHMAVPKLGVKLLKTISPFKPNAVALVLVKKHDKCTTELKLNSSDFVHKEIDENFKLRALFTNLKLLQEFHEHWKHFPSHVEIFQLVTEFLEKLPAENYPDIIQSELNEMKMIVDNAKLERKFEFITLAKKKPKALRLYEPNIQKVYEGKNFKPMSKERADREKLVHKYKKEMKGALREIRRDKSFLGRVKIKEQIQSDYERKEKVRKIYSEASMQQGELNALDRKNKRK